MDATPNLSNETPALDFGGPYPRQHNHQGSERKWLAVKSEHSYFNQWSPPEESRSQDIGQEACLEPAHSETSGSPVVAEGVLVRVDARNRSKWGVMYKGHLLTLYSVNRRNSFGESMLHGAVMQGDLAKLQAMLKLGPNVNMADHSGWTALHEAALRGQYQACVALITAGAKVNVSGHRGVTPLHRAVQNRHMQVVELLLKHRADPWLMDQRGVAAIDLSHDPSLQGLMLRSAPEPTQNRRRGLQRTTWSLSLWDLETDVSTAERSEDESLSLTPVSTQLSDLQSLATQDTLYMDLQEDLHMDLHVESEVELQTTVEDLVPPSPPSPVPTVSPDASVWQASPLSPSLSSHGGWAEHDSGENSDSDHTLLYVSSSEGEEDWAYQPTQNFINLDTSAQMGKHNWHSFLSEFVSEPDH